MVAEAWHLVKPEILRRAWNKLRGISTEEEKTKEKSDMESRRNEREFEDEDSLSLEEIRKIIFKILGCSDVSEEDSPLDHLTQDSKFLMMSNSLRVLE